MGWTALGGAANELLKVTAKFWYSAWTGFSGLIALVQSDVCHLGSMALVARRHIDEHFLIFVCAGLKRW